MKDLVEQLRSLDCEICPYRKDCFQKDEHTTSPCMLFGKAADAIEKLQIELQAMRGAANSYKAENAQLRKDFNTAVERLAVVGYELMQVKKERDAAVAVLRGRCFACKHSRPSEKFKGMFVCDFMDALARNGRFPECKHWQWRGVQEGRK